MTPTPSGRLERSPDGQRRLALTRAFEAPIDDVWASVTEPERTARWYGSWHGEGRAGGTITVQYAFEEGDESGEMRIEACEPPRRLLLSSSDAAGNWLIELELEEAAGTTTLTLTHHLEESTDASMVGPGWEYYLDNLVAARESRSLPAFEGYYPSQKEYYGRLGR
jgi:uncharacterized protein YndB with AHSA1/START domain